MYTYKGKKEKKKKELPRKGKSVCVLNLSTTS